MDKPLVILTRTESDNQRVAPYFEAQELQVLSVPLIEIRNLPINPWDIPNDLCPCVVLITSSRATTRWLALRGQLANRDLRGYLVVGQQSANRLREIDPDSPILVIGNSVEELLEDVVSLRHPHLRTVGEVAPGAREILGEGSDVCTIVYPCSAHRRDEAVVGLQALGFKILELPLYEPILPAGSIDLLANILSDIEPPTAITFFSPSAVENFFHILGSATQRNEVSRDVTERLIFAAIGETTADALYEQGIEEVVVSELPDAGMLAEKVAQVVRESS